MKFEQLSLAVKHGFYSAIFSVNCINFQTFSNLSFVSSIKRFSPVTIKYDYIDTFLYFNAFLKDHLFHSCNCYGTIIMYESQSQTACNVPLPQSIPI